MASRCIAGAWRAQRLRGRSAEHVLTDSLPLQVTLKGTSFMLHQIRHMVGAAVSVARGLCPLDFVEASLLKPARAYMPLAPASVRVLHPAMIRKLDIALSGLSLTTTL